MYGTLLGRDLKPLHVTRWLDAHPGWKGSRRNADHRGQAGFQLGRRRGAAAAQPDQIGEEATPTPPRPRADAGGAAGDHGHDQGPAVPRFRLRHDGNRRQAGEVPESDRRHVNLELGVWVFKEHKTAKRTNKQRIIYLNAAMIELTRKLVEKYPEGPLFRGNREPQGLQPQRCPLPVQAAAGEAAAPEGGHLLHGAPQLRHAGPCQRRRHRPCRGIDGPCRHVDGGKPLRPPGREHEDDARGGEESDGRLDSGRFLAGLAAGT